MSEIQTTQIPRINDPAPEIHAKSTHGQLTLRDYTDKGKYVMLFAHPSDFTPICTTEFIEFARRWDEFDRLGVALVGVSVDSVPSHIAWIRDIERIAGVEVKFPVIADLDFKVSKAYGLIHEAASDTSAVRAVFAIDPQQIGPFQRPKVGILGPFEQHIDPCRPSPHTGKCVGDRGCQHGAARTPNGSRRHQHQN